jgi:N-ethylmaleimide reductase
MTNLFDALKIGDLTLQNRIVMAPLTRMRSKQPGNIPYELNAQYYQQRASAGLIISEATQISNQGQGYPATPGIHSAAQIEGWKLVVDEVHKVGGKIFLQIWHVGRISHSSFQEAGAAPVAPSAIKPSGKTFTKDFKQVDFEMPRALEKQEIEAILQDYIAAAKNALEAGFDGVEVHAANGYLLDQFLQDGSNQRSDEFGGSIENRCKFPLQVVDEVIKIWGAGRVGVRLSPYGTFNDMKDSDPIALFSSFIKELNARKIAYIHLIEPRATSAGGDDKISADAPQASKLFRQYFDGALISAGGYNPQSAKEAVENGDVDAVAFGRLFISNPDLPRRIKENKELNKYNRATFYGGAAKGYTDYASLE